jgi:uracil phosphoribosyltransferase
MPLHIIAHPLASHIMTHLRDVTTKPATFRKLCYQLSLLLAIESTADLPTEDKPIQTPLEPMTGRVLTHQPLVVVPILRAGLGMVQPFLDTFPDVSVGYLGLERDHETAVARNYYCKLPPLAGRLVFLVDPMLATGGSASQAITVAKQHGAVSPQLVCIVAAPEGVAEVEKHHPGTVIHVAALDRALNAKKYILPGLGDFGDRLYGT